VENLMFYLRVKAFKNTKEAELNKVALSIVDEFIRKGFFLYFLLSFSSFQRC